MRKAEQVAPWRCFHCAEVFTDKGEARDHFGADESADAACRIVQRERGLLNALRQAEGEITEWRGRALTAEAEAEGNEHVRAEVRRYFKGARSVWDAFCLLDSMEGRALAAEERALAAEAELVALQSLSSAEGAG